METEKTKDVYSVTGSIQRNGITTRLTQLLIAEDPEDAKSQYIDLVKKLYSNASIHSIKVRTL